MGWGDIPPSLELYGHMFVYVSGDYELEVQDGCVMPDSNGLPECSTLVKQSSECSWRSYNNASCCNLVR